MTDNGSGVLAVLFIIALILVVFVAGPFILIWAVNTLLSLSIAYSGINWFAAWMIIILLRGGSSSKSD